MPKHGPTHVITDEWKEALKTRLDEMGWTYTELGKKVGVTTAAISHLLKNGLQSSLVPEIEQAVGWAKGSVGREGTRDGTTTQVRGAARTTSRNQQQLAMEALKGMFSSPEQLELNSYFQVLKPENRMRLLERARVLWEEEEAGKPPTKGKKP